MTKIDLSALANSPGFGKSKDALIKAGAWDESGPGLKKYVVNVYGTVEVSEAVMVEAESEDAARLIARRRSIIDGIDSTEIVGVIAE